MGCLDTCQLPFHGALSEPYTSTVYAKTVIYADLGNLAAQSISLLHVDDHGHCKKANETIGAAAAKIDSPAAQEFHSLVHHSKQATLAAIDIQVRELLIEQLRQSGSTLGKR